MALTQVKTLGIADDAVTEAKVANDAISPTEMKAGTDGHIITYDASGNPTTVGPGTDGQVLTSTGAGSPPAFEDAAAGGISDVVSDTSPQLGGDLDTNSFEISLDDSHKVKFGDGADLEIEHTGSLGRIKNTTGDLRICGDTIFLRGEGDSEDMIKCWKDGAVKLYHNDSDKLETTAAGVQVNGNLIIGSGGGGIDFSDTSDAGGMTSELLDDYEEGTWTPYLSAGTTGDLSNSGHYSNQDARYTKIGRFVLVNFYIVVYHSDFANMTGDLMIKGLPFAPASGHPNCYVDIAMYSGVNVNDYYNYWATAGYHTDRFYIYGKTGSSQQQAMGSWMDADCTLAGVIPYMMA